jgi:hypothetical protein
VSDLVIDASVAVTWLVPEAAFDKAIKGTDLAKLVISLSEWHA